MSTNTFSGARAIFRVAGQKVAFAANVEGSEEIQYEPVDVLDNLEVQEFVPVGYRITFSCGIFRTIRGTPTQTPGAGPSIGDLTGLPRQPREGVHGSVKEMGFFPKAASDLLSLLTTGVLTCVIEDRLTKKVVMQVEECKMTSHNFSVTSRGIVSENCQWVGIRMRDESEAA
jgi:hypothetical protein